MHCTACDKLLTDYEATRKDAHTFKFIDLCKTCFEDIKPFVAVIDRKDLITEQDLDTIDCDDTDTTDSLEDVDALYSLYDTKENSREDYDV
jgi:hypothetical protein